MSEEASHEYALREAMDEAERSAWREIAVREREQHARAERDGRDDYGVDEMGYPLDWEMWGEADRREYVLSGEAEWMRGVHLREIDMARTNAGRAMRGLPALVPEW